MRLFAIALLVLGVARAQAPAFDSSGNKLLNGSDYFRMVAYTVGDTAGDIGAAITLYGNITFDGNGNYTINCQELDTGNGVVQSVSLSGTYTISASGYGYLSSPVTTGVNLYGLVSNGIFIGSSTEQTVFSDLFIAAPAASTATASSVFNGTYSTAYFSPSGTIADSEDASFQLNPNGAGNLGTVNLSGYYGQGGSSVLTQSSANVKYVISNGAANIMFPNSSTANFIAGNEYAYITSDGNFIFGGSPAGYDMFVGVKTGSSSGFSGLYYTAGLFENEATYASGYADLNTYYGSFTAGNGDIIGHERYTSALSTTSKTFGFTYSDTYPAGSGTYTDSNSSMQYTVGDGGSIRIGLGVGPLLGISVAVQAPSFTGSGVFLNPVGVENAASSAPFTAGVVPGEFVTLYGSNLAPSEQVAYTLPFPRTLNGVQVMINDVAAPIYYVSPDQISVIVPYETTSIAGIQVKNGSGTSNTVTLFVYKTAPGVFTQSENGLGLAAALHADFSLVTASSPATSGETVQVFVTGLGAVVPSVADGAAAPSNPLSLTANTISAAVGGTAATVTFAGLAPGFAGLYQVNVTIPSGLTAGNNALDIIGPDGVTAEAVLPVS